MSLAANKTLIVTGASSGVGRALALELARRGASLVLGARRADALGEVLDECVRVSEGAGAHAAHAMVAGSAAEKSVARALGAAARDLRGADAFEGFVHCAGVLAPGPTLWELSCGEFDAVFDAGPVAAHRLVRACVPMMSARGHGLAVFVGSGAAEIVQPGIAAYCGAKAAEEHLMRQLAAEAPQVTSLVYRPGIVDTPMQGQARASRGGGAEALRAVFVPWKERGELISPERSAAALAALIDEGGVRRFHGLVATVRDGERGVG